MSHHWPKSLGRWDMWDITRRRYAPAVTSLPAAPARGAGDAYTLASGRRARRRCWRTSQPSPLPR
jgi:hypothetical protein